MKVVTSVIMMYQLETIIRLLNYYLSFHIPRIMLRTFSGTEHEGLMIFIISVAFAQLTAEMIYSK